MITLYGFGKVFPPVIGETRDLRAQWALEESGLPYKVHGLDHTAGEHKQAKYKTINPFGLVPSIEDDGFSITESGAVLLYIAEKSGKLIPKDFKGRMQVTQWCFAALATVERPLLEIQLIDKFGKGKDDPNRDKMLKQAHRWMTGLEERLEGRDWIMGEDFTVADILLVTVLREIRKSDILGKYPQVKAYYDRGHARPAWQKTLQLYAERLGVKVEDIA